MSESLSWMQTGDTLALSGELDQDVLLPLWEMREEAVKGITCIDLSRVSRVDTGGLALLLHLIDLAKKQGNNVTLQGVNDKVYTLAKLYNLPADVLPPVRQTCLQVEPCLIYQRGFLLIYDSATLL